ncbi:hypothetical protein ACA086_03295 [Muriicola sp. E247]|uniref:hypothetical protein n=1 Tax=Muriicola sp. E247 TaxID=3242730 RepID=UPI003525D777
MMILIRKTLTAVLVLMTCLGYSQEDGTDLAFSDFYKQMANRDARLEATLEFSTEDDEADYWRDQLNFEMRLKKDSYRAYKTYIYFKKKSYQEHQKECDIAQYHGKGYVKKALFYNIHGLSSSLEDGDVAKHTKIAPTLASKNK